MKKLEELKSISSFKKESDDFLRKIVGGIYVVYYTTTVKNCCYNDARAGTENGRGEEDTWDGPERIYDEIDCPTD